MLENCREKRVCVGDGDGGVGVGVTIKALRL